MIAKTELKKGCIPTALALILLTGCSSSQPPQANGDHAMLDYYLQLAPAGSVGQSSEDSRLQPFRHLFSNLNRAAIENELDEVYAESLYFNDTFHTFTEREPLKRYLLGLADVAETSVTVLDSAHNGQDVLIRWTMRTHSKVAWKTLDIESIGMSHLRFDDQGKIILQQDFWDAAGGFYEHIPLLGTSIKAIRSRLGAE